ncbi:MAG: histidine phosphatase family protein [Pseudomonadota bacterium]
MQRRTLLAGLGATLGAAAGAALAVRPAVAADSAVLDRLAEPGTHAIMRHALAPGTGDPGTFALRDCSTQRNLDARGRAQSRATGAMLRAAGVRIDAVWSSQWCRCLDTARLLDLGPVVEEPSLNSFFSARHRRDEQTQALRERLAAQPPARTLMLVTHFVNVRALVGETATSGEIVVFRLRDGRVRPLGTALVPA